jgi:hypothetical protein
VFGSYSVGISDRTPTILTEARRSFPESLQVTAAALLQVGPLPLPSKSFPIHHHSSLFLPLDAIQFKILTLCEIASIEKYALVEKMFDNFATLILNLQIVVFLILRPINPLLGKDLETNKISYPFLSKNR